MEVLKNGYYRVSQNLFEAGMASGDPADAFNKGALALSEQFLGPFRLIGEAARRTRIGFEASRIAAELLESKAVFDDSFTQPAAGALATLLADYADSPYLDDLHRSVSPLCNRPEIASMIDRLRRESPHGNVRAGLALLQAETLLENRQRGTESAPAERAARAEVLLTEIATHFPDTSEAKQARKRLFAVQHLSCGSTAAPFVAFEASGRFVASPDVAGRVRVLAFASASTAQDDFDVLRWHADRHRWLLILISGQAHRMTATTRPTTSCEVDVPREADIGVLQAKWQASSTSSVYFVVGADDRIIARAHDSNEAVYVADDAVAKDRRSESRPDEPGSRNSSRPEVGQRAREAEQWRHELRLLRFLREGVDHASIAEIRKLDLDRAGLPAVIGLATSHDDEYLAQLKELSERALGDDAAAEALVEVVGLASRRCSLTRYRACLDEAVARLVRQYRDFDAIEPLPGLILRAGCLTSEKRSALLSRLAKSRSEAVRSAAACALVEATLPFDWYDSENARDIAEALFQLRRLQGPSVGRAEVLIERLTRIDVGRTPPRIVILDTKDRPTAIGGSSEAPHVVVFPGVRSPAQLSIPKVLAQLATSGRAAVTLVWRGQQPHPPTTDGPVRYIIDDEPPRYSITELWHAEALDPLYVVLDRSGTVRYRGHDLGAANTAATEDRPESR